MSLAKLLTGDIDLQELLRGQSRNIQQSLVKKAIMAYTQLYKIAIRDNVFAGGRLQFFNRQFD